MILLLLLFSFIRCKVFREDNYDDKLDHVMVKWEDYEAMTVPLIEKYETKEEVLTGSLKTKKTVKAKKKKEREVRLSEEKKEKEKEDIVPEDIEIALHEKSDDRIERKDDKEDEVNQEILDRLEILRMEIETLKKQSAQEEKKLPQIEPTPVEKLPELLPAPTPPMEKVSNNFSEHSHQKENRKKWTPKVKVDEVRMKNKEQVRTWYMIVGVSISALMIAIGVSYFAVRTYWR